MEDIVINVNVPGYSYPPSNTQYEYPAIIPPSQVIPLPTQPTRLPIWSKIKENDDFWWWCSSFLLVGAALIFLDTGTTTAISSSNSFVNKVQSSKVESSKVESSKVESSKVESSKVEAALKLIFPSEGGCQNWSSDSGNFFMRKKGYTCMGITPRVAWNNRSRFGDLGKGFDGHPSEFVKFVHDKNSTAFKKVAEGIYRDQYFIPGGCSNFERPAFEVCSDIAVNSGVGRSRQYLKELSDKKLQAKDLANALNERHRDDYRKWSSSGPNRKFAKGWEARANRRAEYIKSFP